MQPTTWKMTLRASYFPMHAALSEYVRRSCSLMVPSHLAEYHQDTPKLSTKDCSSFVKSSFRCFCAIQRFLFRSWPFGLIEPRRWRPRNSTRSKSVTMRVHWLHRKKYVARLCVDMEDLQPMQFSIRPGCQVYGECLVDVVDAPRAGQGAAQPS